MAEAGAGPIGQEYEAFLARIIDDGIAAATKGYATVRQRPKREGAVAGFEACRGLLPVALAALLVERQKATQALRLADADPENYWYARCFEAEVEWVCNVVSAALMNSGQPTIIPPTARGVMKAGEVLGVPDV